MKKLAAKIMGVWITGMLLLGGGSFFCPAGEVVFAKEPGPGEMEPAAKVTDSAEGMETSTEYVIPEGPSSWKGKWIWNESNDPNSWMRFRKQVTLSDFSEGDSALAYISADSRYWLYVNGELIVREGCEKRGMKTGTIYYDAVDLGSYLKKGENTISMLVWYWGPSDNSSYVSTGRAGMYFQMEAGGASVVSDESWKVSPAANFVTTYNEANGRLPEKDVWYNAVFDPWTQTTYDDRLWGNATGLARAGEAPYGEMVPRQIPMIRDFGVKEYENTAMYADYTVTAEKETLEMKVPANVQLLPRLKIEAAADQLIVIKTDTYGDPNGNSVRAVYVTREGEQEFECLSWMNGDTVLYEIPGGVRVKSLNYREVGYDTSFAGSFSSDDLFLNRLWEKSRRTLYVCMHDTYMDCPTRERAQWFADMAMEMEEAAYCLGPNKEHIYRTGLRTEFGWPGEEGALSAFVPVWGERTELPIQMLMGFNAYWDYYLYSGDLAFLEEIYEPTRAYIENWQIGPDKHVYFMPSRGWKWADSTGNTDIAPIENAWYGMLMKNMSRIAKEIGKEEDCQLYEDRYAVIKEGFQAYWNGEFYITGEVSEPDERANALAVLAGFADESQYGTMTKIFENYYHATPLLEYYVESALMKMGRADLAEMRMKKQYGVMITGKNGKRTSTLWEYWNYGEGSHNHAWSGGPLVLLSRDFAGLSPLSPAWERFQVCPQMGSLSEISCTVPTPSGEISAKIKKSRVQYDLTLTKPAGLTAEISVPVLGKNMKITMNGEDVTKQGLRNGSVLILTTPPDSGKIELHAVCQ